MYDFDIWEGCLSFLSLSVVWNIGCILIKPQNNPIMQLFKSAIISSKESIKYYRDEYHKKVEECTTILHSKVNWENKKVYLIFGKFVSEYLKIDKNLENIELCASLFYPICFSYTCLILSFHSLLGLLLIPVIKNEKTDWILNAYIVFSVFVVLTLFILLIIEIWELFKRNRNTDINSEDTIYDKLSTKYLVHEVYWALLGIGLSIELSDLSCLSFIYSYLEPYIYDVTVLLSCTSFALYFILYSMIEFISKVFVIRDWMCKRKIDPLYEKLKTMITKSSNQNINSQQDSEVDGDQQKQNVGKNSVIQRTNNKQKRKKKKRRAR